MSLLGKRDYWDQIYARDSKTYVEDHSNVGEVWFDENGAENKVVEWTIENYSNKQDLQILDVGTGNGHLLFELANEGLNPANMVGVDYSEKSVRLCQQIALDNGYGNMSFKCIDFVHSLEGLVPDTFDLILDKGTYDAISLSGNPESLVLYAHNIVQLLKTGAHFMITSCNFTENELKSSFERDSVTPNGKLEVVVALKYPNFRFGGQTGAPVATLVFKKI